MAKRRMVRFVRCAAWSLAALVGCQSAEQKTTPPPSAMECQSDCGQPHLWSVWPGEVSNAGGVLLRLNGEHFSTVATVRVAGQPAMIVGRQGSVSVVAAMPELPGLVGPAAVVLTNPDGQSTPQDASLRVHGGGFRVLPPLPGGSRHALASGDFDGDGQLDLALNTQHRLQILRQAGGSFLPDDELPSPATPRHGMLAVDVNNDGIDDLVVAGDDALVIYLGRRGAQMVRWAEYDVGMDPDFPVAGDFNRDGAMDLALINHSSTSLSVLWGDATGHFRLAADEPLALLPLALATGDLNGDGNLDLVLVQADTLRSRSLSVRFGDGQGGFGAPTSYETGPGSDDVDLVITDMNADHFPDVVALDGNVRVYVNDGQGRLNAEPYDRIQDYNRDGAPLTMAVADFTGDGNPDVAIGYCTRQLGAPVEVYTTLLLQRNIGDGQLDRPPVQVQYGNLCARGIAVADFNGDGRLDLAWADALGVGARVLLNQAP